MAGNTISEKSQRKLALFLLGELAAGSWRRGASKAQDGSPRGGMKMNERLRDLRRLKSLSLKRASPHIYLRRFPMIMRRTTLVLPIEAAEPLSRGIGGRIDPSTQSSLVLAEVVADTSFLPAQDDDTRVPLIADFRASPHIYLRRSRHHNPEPRTPNPEPCTLRSIFPLYATIELLRELSHRKKDFL